MMCKGHLFCRHTTVKKPVTAMVTGSFLALLQGVFPLVFPLQVKKGV